jgi:hypothetical protein
MDNLKINPVTVTQNVLKMLNEICSTLSNLLGSGLVDDYQVILLESLHFLGAILSGSEVHVAFNIQ